MDGFTKDGQKQFISAVVCSTIAGVAVVLRLIAKYLKAGFAGDDWLIILALLSFFTSEGLCIWGLFAGGKGETVEEMAYAMATGRIGVGNIEVYLKSLYISFVFYFVTVAAIKMSILWFYRRIFAIESFRRVALISMVVVVIWFLGAELTNILVCLPVQSFWNPTVKGHCLNFDLFFLVIGIIETVIDLFILILPVPVISTIQLPPRSKIMLYGIFLLGGFAIITDIVRIAFIYQPHNKYVNFTNGELWSNIHVCVSIVCACLTVFRPLMVKIATITENIQKFYSSLRGRSSRSSSQSSLPGHGKPIPISLEQEKQWREFDESLSDNSAEQLTVTQVTGGFGGLRDGNFPPRSHIGAFQRNISVTRSYDVV